MGEETPQPGNSAEPHGPAAAAPHTHGHAHGFPVHLSFFEKFKRRNVGRVAVLYVVVGYLVLEVFEMFFHLLDMPAWTGKAVLLLMVLGFPAALVFAWIYEVTPEGLKLSDEVHPAHSIAHHTGRRIDRAIITVLAIALAYFVMDKFWLSKGTAPTAIAAAVPTSGAMPATGSPGMASDKSVAILPLKNESNDPNQEYFSDGLSEGLITALSQVSELKVIGRSSSFHFKNSQETSASIGRQLGVAHLIEGSVQRDGQTIRVSAELINAADGRTLWSQRYDRPYKNLFALQDELTQAVAQALKTRLLPAAQAQHETDRPPSGNLDAYNAYLQGRFFVHRQNEQDFRQAVAYFTQATQLDPKYVQAWSGLSIAWESLAQEWLEGTSVKEAHAKSRAAAESARTLSPDAVATHLAWGNLLQFVDFDWRGAEAQYRRALELAPDNSEVKYSLADLLAAVGQVESAVRLMRAALVLDPLRATGYAHVGVYLLGLNQLDEAEKAARKAISLQPGDAGNHQVLAMIEIQRGDAKAALEFARQEVPGTWSDIALAQALAIGSDRVAADAALETLVNHLEGQAAYQIAQTYALRHDPDRMFQWLDRAWAQRDAGITYLLNDPFILRYKDDPRLSAYCRKVGLPTPAGAARNKNKST